MVPNLTNNTVTWYDESDAYSTNFEITNDIIGVPLYTETGSGESNEAELVLAAKRW